ncbi:MAG: putative pyridoxal kinase [Sclerophora amabilis]|nr:MAG: putative pyridoxal kinase [Sclerophora amabilis]
MATFVMQSLGCEVAALNTVHFSNHTAYKQFTGTKATADEIRDIYDGLKQSYLNDFDMLLSGYIPNAEAVNVVGTIARDLKLKSSMKPGSFFWVLDPVMGDQGKLYVDEEVVPAYKNLLRDADLILPNQYEAELLSSTPITDLSSLTAAITTLHQTYQIPHILITSVRFPATSPTLSIIGSTTRSSSPSSPARIFKIDIPAIDCFFSGTGDMFAALIVARLREACTAAAAQPDDGSLTSTKSWVSPDDVPATELPLAKATEKVLASMQAVLGKTKDAMDVELDGLGGELGVLDKEGGSEKRMHLRRTKAAEVRLVGNVRELKEPTVEHFAEALEAS